MEDLETEDLKALLSGIAARDLVLEIGVLAAKVLEIAVHDRGDFPEDRAVKDLGTAQQDLVSGIGRQGLDSVTVPRDQGLGIAVPAARLIPEDRAVLPLLGRRALGLETGLPEDLETGRLDPALGTDQPGRVSEIALHDPLVTVPVRRAAVPIHALSLDSGRSSIKRRPASSS